MRLSQLSGKEIIDLENGERLGMVGQADLVINEDTGLIEAIILPEVSFFGFKRKREAITIPWQAVRKIGPEMMIIELSERVYVRE